MAINYEILQEVIAAAVEPTVFTHFGADAARYLERLWRTVRNLYRIIAPESYPGRIQVVISRSSKPVLSEPPHAVFSLLETRISGLTQEDFVLQILETGEFCLWIGKAAAPPLHDDDALIYQYCSGIEHLYVNSEVKLIPQILGGQSSSFAAPTFRDLEDALEHYGSVHARLSGCRILKAIWDTHERLYLIARTEQKPEELMRRSLEQHLKSRLQGAEVRPEQNVNESKPVDLTVRWTLTRRHALIEIKWLGKSVDEAGKVTKDHTNSRANDGAKQLVDYLDSDHEFSSDFVNRGYLVVFDARRKGLSQVGKAKKVPDDPKHLVHYRHQEIEYSTRFESIRADFNRPIRFFLEPGTTKS